MKGICFKEPLFLATVTGNKTQTRRIVSIPKGKFGIQATIKNGQVLYLRATDENERPYDDNGSDYLINPRYKVGEKVYLKEPYINDSDYYFSAFPIHETMGSINKPGYLYLYGNDDEHICSVYGEEVRWGNKLFMPVSAARYFIEITNVRAERLQDISGYDCIKEGIDHKFPRATSMTQARLDYESAEPGLKEKYAKLIDRINGRGTWDSNPWMWVYDYKLVGK